MICSLSLWEESVPDVNDFVGHEVSAGSVVEPPWLEFQPVISGRVVVQRKKVYLVNVIATIYDFKDFDKLSSMSTFQ